MSFQPGPWCSNKNCPCATPGRPCANFEGFDKKYGRFDKADKETWPFRYCICCGFERADHKQLIHKGGKP